MTPRGTIVLGPKQGRIYDMPGMRAVFKADGEETADSYSVSEWWLKPYAKGPGSHSHAGNDEIFHVLAGTISILAGDRWLDAEAGTLAIIPAGVVHDFRNRTGQEAGLLNVFVPGGVERQMPEIVRWYADHAQPAKRA